MLACICSFFFFDQKILSQNQDSQFSSLFAGRSCLICECKVTVAKGRRAEQRDGASQWQVLILVITPTGMGRNVEIRGLKFNAWTTATMAWRGFLEDAK